MGAQPKIQLLWPECTESSADSPQLQLPTSANHNPATTSVTDLVRHQAGSLLPKSPAGSFAESSATPVSGVSTLRERFSRWSSTASQRPCLKPLCKVLNLEPVSVKK